MMGRVVDLATAREARAATVEELWDRYVEATRTAQQTLALEDGIRAGRAYGEFLRRFVREAS
jgi:hypothetical protein